MATIRLWRSKQILTELAKKKNNLKGNAARTYPAAIHTVLI